MDTHSSGNCHAQAHRILEGLHLQTGSLCNCPSLIPSLVILGTPESQAITRLTLAYCLPVAYMGQQNSHGTKSNKGFGSKMPFHVGIETD